MGPAGSGKTTIGRLLAVRVGARFVDADDFHSPSAIDKMARGIALSDQERRPWLLRLARLLHEAQPEEPIVLACSALKEEYRALLRTAVDEPDASPEPTSKDGQGIHFFYLRVARDELAQRLATRGVHFAGPALLDSQLATLEEPKTGAVDASLSPEQVCTSILDQLGC